MRKLSSEKITAIAEERAAALAKQRAVGSKTKVYTAEEMKQSAVNLDKAPYDPRTIESMLKVNNPVAEITSTTVPDLTKPNVKLAGTFKEAIINDQPVRINFDERGFPIFDKHVKYETRISGNLSEMSMDAHMRAATRQLRADIETGVVQGNMFNDNQMKQIMSGFDKIDGYTWHHHQDVGRMQLLPEELNKKFGHVGGNDLWGMKK